ncbi:MAG TPA: hypothetical protein VIJ01_10390 [Candidatus Angelobacter sp.]
MPQLLLDRLLLKEGDELEFEVADAKIHAVRALKLVPVEYFDAKTLEVLKQRAAQIDRPAEEPSWGHEHLSAKPAASPREQEAAEDRPARSGTA